MRNRFYLLGVVPMRWLCLNLANLALPRGTRSAFPVRAAVRQKERLDKTFAIDNFGLCIHIMDTNLANPEKLFRANDVIFIDHVLCF